MDRPNADIRDLRDVPRLARKVHWLLDWSATTDNDTQLIADIVCTLLHVAICDWCREEWFTVRPTTGLGPRGDVRGLLVAGGATCTKCLDRLYEASIDFEQEELDEVRHDLARWFNRNRAALNSTEWGKDDEIRALMKRYSH